MNPGNPYCHSDPGFITKATALGSYTVPKIDVLDRAARSAATRAASSAATWNAPVALVSAALGRPADVVGTTVPISLVAPGQVWGDRVNAFDLRFAKILPVRSHAVQRRDRHHQRDQLERDPDLQPELQPGGHDRLAGLAGADSRC